MISRFPLRPTGTATTTTAREKKSLSDGLIAVSYTHLLFAACHVLLRLLMPRHPPYALYSLNMSFLRLYRFERKDLPLLNSTYIATVAALCPSSLSVRLRLFLPSRINSYSVVNEHLLQPSPSCGLRADICLLYTSRCV